MRGKQSSHNRGHEYGGQQIREPRGVAQNRPGDLDALRDLTDDERRPALREALGFGEEPVPAVEPEPEPPAQPTYKRGSGASDFDMSSYVRRRDNEDRRDPYGVFRKNPATETKPNHRDVHGKA
jgi:hypothetical protein